MLENDEGRQHDQDDGGFLSDEIRNRLTNQLEHTVQTLQSLSYYDWVSGLSNKIHPCSITTETRC